MPMYAWLTIAGLVLLLGFVAAIGFALNRELEYAERRAESLEDQVEWLTEQRGAVAQDGDPGLSVGEEMAAEFLRANQEPRVSCVRCGRPECPHPVLTDQSSSAYLGVSP